MKAEIKEYCIRCGICVGLYPQLFAHNFEKDCIDVKYDEIPAELEESAFMDGASYWTIFRKIIWPLCTPILATIAIFGAVGHWNSFTDSLILMQDASNLFTLQHRLYLYLNTSSNIGALMNSGVSSSVGETLMQSALNAKVIKYTISMVSIIPILMVYPLMQRYFVKGIMLGAVKG